ncbi:CUE domain protein [Penicillium brasilianum]|uniref:CUE domain protein n=1 Tax=Penicillium brasilianum TaxID=104259 RepID=A0A1S9RHK1_PENBI|nr:CUE domain protein [Penicillium brasilianum]
MAEFPPLAPVPSPAVRRTIPSNDWDACLDAWMTLLGIRLSVMDQKFKDTAPDDLSVVSFLDSFYQHAAAADSGLRPEPKVRQLRKLCFLTTRRYLLSLRNPPEGLLSWQLLSNLCCCYPSSTALKTSLSTAWDLHHEKISSSIEKAKSLVMKQISMSGKSAALDVISSIRRLTILASVLPNCGQILMAGSDYLDTLHEAYQAKATREELRKILVANVYVGLVSLLKETTINLSLLLDQLFSLKASAGVGTPGMKKEATLLSDLVCSSDLLQRLEKHLASHPQKRGEDLLASLRLYQMEMSPFHHRYQRRKRVDKGKGPSTGPVIPDELHAHKMSLVSQVQDLFPDLGSAFVVRLLDTYGDNPETVIAHLLDDSLTPELQSLDRSEQLPPAAEPSHAHLEPRPTPPAIPSPRAEAVPSRRNIFDDDVDIAELSLSGAAEGKLRFGRANPELTADEVLADRSKHAINKAAILSALASFDSDDDERDDTYDVADVGGTVDSATTGTDAEADAIARNQRAAAEQIDLTLLRAYKSNAAIFARDSATRRSQPRTLLKQETNMTDEAIEGWAVMLSRDPKRLAKLENKLADDIGGAGGGALNQPELAPTSYRRPHPTEGDSDEGESSGYAGGRGGRGGGRGGAGRGRGRGGRGGGRPPQSGEQGQQNSAVAHQRKEQNKASRANHNRRQQRAKKIARGGGLPG